MAGFNKGNTVATQPSSVLIYSFLPHTLFFFFLPPFKTTEHHAIAPSTSFFPAVRQWFCVDMCRSSLCECDKALFSFFFFVFFLFCPRGRWVWSSISLIAKAWHLTELWMSNSSQWGCWQAVKACSQPLYINNFFFFLSMLAVIKRCEVKYSSSSCMDKIEPPQDNQICQWEVNVNLQLA